MVPVEYLAHPAAQGLFEAAAVYAKRETTAQRLPSASEIGSALRTYKANPADPAGYSLESEIDVHPGMVMARNSNLELGRDAGGAPIFNDWAIPRETVERNYGADVLASLGWEFREHRKKATVRAVRLTDGLLARLGAEPGEPLAIKAPWSSEPMTAHEGDFLTDQGYPISAANMLDYDLVEPAPPAARLGPSA